MEPLIRIQGRLGKRQREERAKDASRRASEGDARRAYPFPDTMARRLALAHYIERLIDSGQLRNYAQAAAVLGITRARVTQLMDLVLMPADVQESVILGGRRFDERELRRLLPTAWYTESKASARAIEPE